MFSCQFFQFFPLVDFHPAEQWGPLLRRLLPGFGRVFFFHFQNLLTFFFPQFIDERAGGCGTAMFSAFDSGAGGRLDDFVLLVMIR